MSLRDIEGAYDSMVNYREHFINECRKVFVPGTVIRWEINRQGKYYQQRGTVECQLYEDDISVRNHKTGILLRLSVEALLFMGLEIES